MTPLLTDKVDAANPVAMRRIVEKQKRSSQSFGGLVIWGWVAFGAILAGCDESMTVPEGCRAVDIGLTPPSPKPSASGSPVLAQEASTEVSVDPVSLRKLLFEGDTAILLGVNHVHQSKESVNIARGNLLPSINLGAMLSVAAGGAFSLSSVDFLLPFLVPSRWFDYFQIKNMLEADKLALRVLKVNEYASALSLYMTILGDKELTSILSRDAKDFGGIEAYVEKAFQVGQASRDDLDLIKGQAGLARVRLSKVMNLVIMEEASMRHALGLDLNTKMTWVPNLDIPASEWEDRDLNPALEHAVEKSLEFKQIDFLHKAAQDATWSKVFGFITGASLRGITTPPQSTPSFSNIFLSESMGIGFAYFPMIRLSRLNEDAMKIRKREVGLEIAETLEKILKTMDQTKLLLKTAQGAETAYQDAYLSKLQQFKLGMIDLTQVLQARVSLSTSRVEVLNAKVQVILSRINLHRAMLSEQFADIQGCAVQAPEVKM